MVSMSRFSQIPEDIKYVIEIPVEKSKRDCLSMICNRIIYDVEQNGVTDVAVKLPGNELWVLSFEEDFYPAHYDEKCTALLTKFESIINLDTEEEEEIPSVNYGIFTKVQNFFTKLLTKDVPLPEVRQEEYIRKDYEDESIIPEALEALEDFTEEDIDEE